MNAGKNKKGKYSHSVIKEIKQYNCTTHSNRMAADKIPRAAKDDHTTEQR
jgi:hypothetical protein